MAQKTVIAMTDGSFKIRTEASVLIDPRLEKQGQNVLNQLSGGHTMPEKVRAEIANRPRRSQIVG